MRAGIGVGDDVGGKRQWHQQCPGKQLLTRKLTQARQPGATDTDDQGAQGNSEHHPCRVEQILVQYGGT